MSKQSTMSNEWLRLLSNKFGAQYSNHRYCDFDLSQERSKKKRAIVVSTTPKAYGLFCYDFLSFTSVDESHNISTTIQTLLNLKSVKQWKDNYLEPYHTSLLKPFCSWVNRLSFLVFKWNITQDYSKSRAKYQMAKVRWTWRVLLAMKVDSTVSNTIQLSMQFPLMQLLASYWQNTSAAGP